MLYHHKNRTKVWIADYSSAYKSIESLSEPDMIKVVQVEVYIWTIPEDFRNEIYPTVQGYIVKTEYFHREILLSDITRVKIEVGRCVFPYI